jgi:hypothetical protein
MDESRKSWILTARLRIATADALITMDLMLPIEVHDLRSANEDQVRAVAGLALGQERVLHIREPQIGGLDVLPAGLRGVRPRVGA